MSATDREHMILLLRALAALLENDEAAPTPHGIDVAFFPGSAEEARAVMTALPLPWQALEQDRSYQRIRGRVGAIGSDFDVNIYAKPADVSAQTGVVEVPVWGLRPEIAALLEAPEGETGGEQA